MASISFQALVTRRSGDMEKLQELALGPPKDTLEKMEKPTRGQITSAEYVEAVKQA